MSTTSAAYLAPHDVPLAETILNDHDELAIPDGYIRVGVAAHSDDEGMGVRHGIGHVWLDIHVTDSVAFARLASTERPSRLLVVTTRGGEGDGMVHHAQAVAHAVVEFANSTSDGALTVTMHGGKDPDNPEFYREFWAGPGLATRLATSTWSA